MIFTAQAFRGVLGQFYHFYRVLIANQRWALNDALRLRLVSIREGSNLICSKLIDPKIESI